MREIFLSVLNLSVQASFLIVAVLLLRLMLKNSPKWVRYILWGMVALRLLVPFSFESRLSVLPNAQKIDSTSLSSTSYVSTSYAVADTTASTTQSVDVMTLLSYIWVFGVAVMLCYMLLSFLKVHRMVKERVKLRDNIYICDHVDSPFVLGMVSPKIYLNSSLSKSECRYIIAHEQTHIRHRDNIWKPLGFFTLCLYWFNPLVWVSYFLFVKDVELFCDESVVKTLSKTGKKKYSSVLLSCSVSKATVPACPLAFAENGVKSRVKNILSYKKPALYVVVISVILCVITMVFFMTSPVSTKETENVEVAPTEVETEAVTEVLTEAPSVNPTEPPTEKPTQKPTEAPKEVQNIINTPNSTQETTQVEIQSEQTPTQNVIDTTETPEPTSVVWEEGLVSTQKPKNNIVGELNDLFSDDMFINGNQVLAN
ncbi:MAG: hypothetical protein IJO20_06430 [Ruminococcus sp.]|nr:hypothetical protein [Ruminococcus sp.]